MQITKTTHHCFWYQKSEYDTAWSLIGIDCHILINSCVLTNGSLHLFYILHSAGVNISIPIQFDLHLLGSSERIYFFI